MNAEENFHLFIKAKSLAFLNNSLKHDVLVAWLKCYLKVSEYPEIWVQHKIYTSICWCSWVCGFFFCTENKQKLGRILMSSKNEKATWTVKEKPSMHNTNCMLKGRNMMYWVTQKWLSKQTGRHQNNQTSKLKLIRRKISL